MTESMLEEPVETLNELQQPHFHKEWLWRIWLSPRKTLREIGLIERRCWEFPLLILSAIQLIKSLLEIPIQKAAASAEITAAINQTMQNQGLAGNVSADQIAQIQQSMAYKSGFLFTFVVPLISGLAVIWLIWLILSSLLHLSLTLTGSRTNSNSTFNLTAWASLPIGIRLIIQTIATLLSGQVITHPGLSGFVTVQGRLTMMLAAILSFMDIYILWELVYLMIGLRQTSHVQTLKAIALVLGSFLVTIIISALPGFLSAYLATLGGNSITFF